MAEKGFITDTQQEILNGTYEGTDESERAAEYRLRNRTEQSLKDLIRVAESEEIEVDPEIWYRYIPRLIHAVMEPEDGITPLQEFEGGELEHRKQYPLQYNLLERLTRIVNAYERAYHPEEHPGGVVTRLPEELRE